MFEMVKHIEGKCVRCGEAGVEHDSLSAFNYDNNFLCQDCFKLWIKFLKFRKTFFAMEKDSVEGKKKFSAYWDKLFTQFCLTGKEKVIFS